jgi:hypothetical protein
MLILMYFSARCSWSPNKTPSNLLDLDFRRQGEHERERQAPFCCHGTRDQTNGGPNLLAPEWSAFRIELGKGRITPLLFKRVKEQQIDLLAAFHGVSRPELVGLLPFLHACPAV